MKPIYITCAINMAVVMVMCSFFASNGTDTVADYLTHASLISLLWSALCIVLGLLLLAFRQKHWGESLLFVAGILLVLGFMEYSFSGFIV